MDLKHEYEKLIGLINKCLKHSDYTDDEDPRIYKIKEQIFIVNLYTNKDGKYLFFPFTDGGSRRKLEMMRSFARKKVKEYGTME